MPASEQVEKAVTEHTLLTREEEVELFQKYHEGDYSAYEKLITHNLRLVSKIASVYENSFLDQDDLFQEGVIGLDKAIKSYDETRGLKFSTYATQWIRQAIGRAISDKGRAVRIPVNKQDNMSKVRTTVNKLFNKTGVEPTMDEVAAEMKISRKKLDEILTANQAEYSINKEIPTSKGWEEAIYFIEDKKSVNPEKEAMENIKKEIIHNILQSELSDFERKIIYLFYGFYDSPKSLREIAIICNVTLGQVRSAQSRAIRKLSSKGLSFLL